MQQLAEILPPGNQLEAQSLDRLELNAIQANIRRYGWQALAVRLLAITLASLFMVFGCTTWRPILFRFWPVVCLFLLWTLEGHYKFMQKQYVDLYPRALDGKLTDLSVQVNDRFNVASLWRPMIMAPYAIIIGLFALANLGI